MILGFIPLVPFLVSILIPAFVGIDIILSIFLSLVSFIFIGYIGARLTNMPHVKNIIRTVVVVGSIAASISFIVGYLLSNII